MEGIAEAFRTGGIWMYLILLLTVLSGLWTVIQTVVNALGVRLPAVGWWVGLFLIAVVGALGLGSSLSEALAALPAASPENRQALAARGASLALNIAAFAAIVSAVLGGLVALGAGISNVVGSGDGAEYAWGTPVGVAAAALVGALAVGAATVMMTSVGAGGFFISCSLFFGGIGSAIAAVPAVDADAPARLASGRLTAAGATLYSVVFGVLAVATLGFIEVFNALEHATPGNRERMLWEGVGMVTDGATVLGGIGLVAGATITALLVSTATSQLGDRIVIRDGILCAAGLFVVFMAFVYAGMKIVEFQNAVEAGAARTEASRTVDSHRTAFGGASASGSGGARTRHGPDLLPHLSPAS